MRHAHELAGQGPAVPRFDDLADRQPVDDHAGGERPVTGLRGVPQVLRPGEPAGGGGGDRLAVHLLGLRQDRRVDGL